MIAVAKLIDERPATCARTLRAMGAGLSDLGGGLSWGEAYLLFESAAADHSTLLGAELAGWAYAASMPELISLAAQVGDAKAFKKVAPWTLGAQNNSGVTGAEIQAAQDELADSMIFAV